MKRLALAALLSLASAPGFSQELNAAAPDGAVSSAQTLKMKWGAAGAQADKPSNFTCERATGSDGLVCSGLLPDAAYKDKVTFFTASARLPDDAEIVLYLHGLGDCDQWVRKNSNFGDLLRASGRTDALLVIPCGQDPWARGDSAGFQRFWAGVQKQIAVVRGAPLTPRALVLAGHSHAGYGLARVLNFAAAGSYPPIKEVYLFDCSFSDDPLDDAYATYAKFGASGGNRLLSIIRVGQDNPKIMAQLDDRHAPYAKLDGDAVLAGRQRLPATGTAFLTVKGSDVVHGNIMNRAFPLLLAKP
jgi:hypothetical protein